MVETVAPRRKKGWMNLKVTRVIEETWDTKTFVMEDAEDGSCPFDYIAGQYLTFRFDDISERAVARSYTMSSSPNQEGFAAVTIKRVVGGLVSNYFCDKVIEGSVLKARGPIGRFTWDSTRCRKQLVMVGAGSGVTPFISILRAYADTLGQEGSPEKMTLLVAYRSKQDLICWDDIIALQKVPGIRIFTTLTREDARAEGFLHGRPDEPMLVGVCEDTYEDATYMTCGPDAMMKLVCEFLQKQNVPDEHIMLESFGD